MRLCYCLLAAPKYKVEIIAKNIIYNFFSYFLYYSTENRLVVLVFFQYGNLNLGQYVSVIYFNNDIIINKNFCYGLFENCLLKK